MAFDFKEFPTLETDRLILRELTQADAQDFFDIWTDPAIEDGFDATGFMNLAGARKHLQVKSNAFKRKQLLTWGIESKDSSRLMGACLYGNFARRTKADISYYLLSEFCGQGIMSEALEPVVEFGLEEMRLHRIQALISPDNVASIRVIEKLGFHREGCLRKSHYSQQRDWVDKISYSLLSTD